MARSGALLDISGLSLTYRVGQRAISALDDVTFAVKEADVLGIVGESGSGKSTLSAAILRLLPANAEIVAGSVRFAGEELLRLDERRMNALRGAGIGMIFQNPLSSLHPCLTIGRQMHDAQRAHGAVRRRTDSRRRAAEMLRQVGLPDAEERLNSFPHEFSGGMRQRIMIALALLLNPKLLIADEPTSALDVTLQAQIMQLLREIRQRYRTAIIMISHDLGVVSGIADSVIVMYGGQVVEHAPARGLFRTPLHPYTEALLDVVPSRRLRGRELQTIPGRVPVFIRGTMACRFANRCRYAEPVCHERPPVLSAVDDRRVRCLMYEEGSGHSRAGRSRGQSKLGGTR